VLVVLLQGMEDTNVVVRQSASLSLAQLATPPPANSTAAKPLAALHGASPTRIQATLKGLGVGLTDSDEYTRSYAAQALVRMWAHGDRREVAVGTSTGGRGAGDDSTAGKGGAVGAAGAGALAIELLQQHMRSEEQQAWLQVVAQNTGAKAACRWVGAAWPLE
jgi:hypothetical protein